MSGGARTVVVVGSAGQLGTDLIRCWQGRPGDRVWGLARSDLDVTDLAQARAVLARLEPAVVVNATAYNLVDAAEAEPQAALAVNALGPRNLALVCRELDATLVHVSTDYVFSGKMRRPYVEDDPVEPLSVYGVSKAAGEMLIRATWQRHFIVRTSGLYGLAGSRGKGGNFVDTMLRLARSGQPIRVVDDQVLTPTHTAELALQIAHLVATDAYGTYHATCQGECSWYEFAAEIFRQASIQARLEPQSTAEAGRAARRPPYSVLHNRNLQRLGLDLMPHWRDALGGYLRMRLGGEVERRPGR